MNALGILGGVGLGITRGAEDWRRADEEARRARMFARQEKEWADADALTEMRKGIKPVGDYTETTYGAPGEQEAPTQRTVRRTEADYSRDLAKGYAGLGRADLATSEYDRAYTLDKRAQSDAAMKRIAELTNLHNTNPQAARDLVLGHYNQNVPDGYTAAGMSVPGKGEVIALINSATGRAEKYVPITPNLMQSAIRATAMSELGGLSPEMYLRTIDADLNQQKVGIEERKAGILQSAHDLNARRLTEVDIPAMQSTGTYQDRLGRAALARANTESAAIQNLQARQKLLAEYGANMEGYETARRLGLTKGTNSGPSAADIYAARGYGLASQLRGLGANVTVPGQEKVQRKVQVQKNDAGGFTAFDVETGEPVYNVSGTGRKLPLGMDEASMTAMAAEARVNGVTMGTVDVDGMLVAAYLSNDGRQWETIEEAKEANKGLIRQSRDERLRESRRGTPPATVPTTPLDANLRGLQANIP